MFTLSGLPGKTETIPAVFFDTADEVEDIINSGGGATTAGINGAINIYRDDNGRIRGNAQRHYVTFNEITTDSVSDMKAWVCEMLNEIK